VEPGTINLKRVRRFFPLLSCNVHISLVSGTEKGFLILLFFMFFPAYGRVLGFNESGFFISLHFQGHTGFWEGFFSTGRVYLVGWFICMVPTIINMQGRLNLILQRK